MRGLMNFAPWPDVSMSDPLVVEAQGTTLALGAGDPRVQTEDPVGQDPPAMRPSRSGDVLSLQPGGLLQGRPQGTNGGYEQVAMNGALATFCPTPNKGDTRSYAIWLTVPNL